jgi:protein-disulfide isomerase
VSRVTDLAEQTGRRRREQLILVIAVVAVVLLLVGAAAGYQFWRTSRLPAAIASPAHSDGFAATTLERSKPIRLGKPDAPVTITLYEDFHCPHCADFEEKFGPTITAAQNAGTAAVELWPMAFVDAGSVSAANAMACAADAGFAQPYYQGLFANHTLRWSSGQLISMADQLTGGRTPDGFTTCVEQGRRRDWMNSINNAADAAGITQTPTMLIDGQPVDITTLTVDDLERRIAAVRQK